MSDTLCKTAHTLVSVSGNVEQEGTGPNKPCMKPAGTRKCVKTREGGLRVEEAADQRKKKQTEQTHETKPELKTGLQHKLH